jgi:hypothetical protein
MNFVLVAGDKMERIRQADPLLKHMLIEAYADCLAYFHRAAAAFLAIFFRSSPERLSARAFAPARPDRMRPDFGTGSSISPVAMRMTWTALPITSAGRFSPLGPRGIGF